MARGRATTRKREGGLDLHDACKPVSENADAKGVFEKGLNAGLKVSD